MMCFALSSAWPVACRGRAGCEGSATALLTFKLQAQGIAFPTAYTACSNRVADIPADAMPKATAALRQLLKDVSLAGQRPE